MAQAPALGIDFGTSNSALACVGPDGACTFAQHQLLGTSSPSFRSLLYFDPEHQEKGSGPVFHAGPEAIEHYLEAYGDGRLIQSFKTHLSGELLGRTQIGPHRLDLDSMLTLFFSRFRERCAAALGFNFERAVIGRPVRFAGAQSESDNDRAMARIRKSAERAGFAAIDFEFEPIAAAFHYERQLSCDQIALIADFGGGTTDYCVMRMGPSRRDGRDRCADILATGGVGVAGDDLDARLIEHLVCPHLGLGSYYNEMGRRHEIPGSYYRKLAHWHHLSFLSGAETRNQLGRLAQFAEMPEKIRALISLIENNRGFYLHKAIEATKVELSHRERASFRYADDDADFSIDLEVTQEQFASWIAPEIAAIAAALDETLASGAIDPSRIDRVFLTGGTAFVPAVRDIFVQRFGGHRLCGGDELLSIASGLAYRAHYLGLAS
jgi:hypothetical chaperone protein